MNDFDLRLEVVMSYQGHVNHCVTYSTLNIS